MATSSCALPENRSGEEDEMMFGAESGWVEARISCDHLIDSLSSDLAHLQTLDTPCNRCQHPSENWLCLCCKEVLCSRFVNKHMLRHYQKTNHCVALSYRDLSVWCYACDAYLEAQVILKLGPIGYILRFGKALPLRTIEYPKEKRPGEEVEMMFGAKSGRFEARTTCDHLIGSLSSDLPHIPTLDTPCNRCQHPSGSWLCFCCKKVLCSRFVKKHMLRHYRETNHCVALSYRDLSVWCYACDAYLEAQVILKLRPIGYILKFGKALPRRMIEHPKENRTEEEDEMMFGTKSGRIEARISCDHLIDSLSSDLAHIQTLDTPCNSCQHPSENWLCLCCKEVLCSRFVNKHMLRHYQKTNHCVALSYRDLSVWCYACDAYLEAQVILKLGPIGYILRFGKAVPLRTIEHPKENRPEEENEMMFKAKSSWIEARTACDHLIGSLSFDLAHIPTLDTPCNRCQHPSENWLCLCCKEVLCSRFVNKHMLRHYQETNHCVALSYRDLSVWCYACDAYLEAQVILKLPPIGCNLKFGKAPPLRTIEHPKENRTEEEDEVMFGAKSGRNEARTSCHHLIGSLSSDFAHIPTLDTHCNRCQHPSENWLCLCCKEVLCSRFVNKHMLRHYQKTNHCVALSYRDLSVWCYACDAYLEAQVILKLGPIGYILRFGKALPLRTIEYPKENRPGKEDVMMFGSKSGWIEAQTSCHHLIGSLSSDLAHIPTLDTHCNSCQHPSENWLCLCCKKVLCSRFVNKHMLRHYQETNHCVALSYSDLSVSCYACDAYLEAQVILKLGPTGYILKFGKALPLRTIEHPKEKRPGEEVEMMFGAKSGRFEARTSCDHLIGSLSSDLAHIPTLDTPCNRCQHPSESWLCFCCKKVLCSRFVKKHMLRHYRETNHCVALSYRDLSVWCYACDAYLEAQVILKLPPIGYILKFGKALPCRTIEHPKENRTEEEDGMMFGTKSGRIEARTSCDHLIGSLSSDLAHIPTLDTDCNRCQHPSENWLCLCCKKVLCSRFVNKHMLRHYQETNHCVALSYRDLSVWCYACNAYLEAQVILKLPPIGCNLKFGKAPPLPTIEHPEVEDKHNEGHSYIFK